jgi:hypothetical protein
MDADRVNPEARAEMVPAPGLQNIGGLSRFIDELRQRVGSNRRVFVEPEVKAWCARRWRFLFLNEAVNDPVALGWATRYLHDRRPARQRIAEYFFLGEDQAAWRDEQPSPAQPRIRTTTLVVCPGMLNGLLPMLRDFKDQLPRIETRFALRVLRSDSHPMRGCNANVADLLRALDEGKGLDAAGREIPERDATAPGDVALFGYSKGAPDILTLLAQHPELKSRVRCVFTWAGAIGGSEVADKEVAGLERSRMKQDALAYAGALKATLPPGFRLGRYTGRRLPEFDTAGVLRDLTTGVRRAFLSQNSAKLDALDIPMFYFKGATRLSEVPLSQRSGFRLLSRVDANNDMQVTSKNASLPMPMATDLGLLRGHHWDLAYPSFVKGRWFGLNKTYHPFPKEAALTAIVTLAAELGLID